MAAKTTRFKWFEYEYINSQTPYKFFVFKDRVINEYGITKKPKPFHHMIVYDEQKSEFVPLNLHDSNLVETQGDNSQLIKAIFNRIRELEEIVLVCYPEMGLNKVVDVF
jgi:hypothetical protein